MTCMSERYLVVEGTFDCNFFNLLLNKYSIRDVKIYPPKYFGAGYNGKGNAINVLPDLIKQFQDGRSDKIALIVDSDFISISKQGFNNTLGLIKQKIEPEGYELFTQSCNYNKGLIFKNTKGLPDIAVWIMPNNSSEGYLETLLLDSLKEREEQYFTETKRLYRSIKKRKFPDHHKCKAKLAFHMAIQENPGRNISHIITNDIIDFDSGQIKMFIDWLKSYFQP